MWHPETKPLTEFRNEQELTCHCIEPTPAVVGKKKYPYADMERKCPPGVPVSLLCNSYTLLPKPVMVEWKKHESSLTEWTAFGPDTILANPQLLGSRDVTLRSLDVLI